MKQTLQLAERGLDAACLSDLMLDRLRLGELTDGSARTTEQHLSTCERCRNRAAALAAEELVRSRELPPLEALIESRVPSARARPRPGRVRWWAPALAALSAAAVLAVFLGPQPVREGEIRLKGVGGELDVFVKRADEVFRWQTQPLRPGDRLRYSFRAPEPTHVMLLSREASGTVNQYFPTEPRSFAVDRGVTLSQVATELDATLGQETLWVVFCRTAFTAEGLLAQLRRDGAITAAEGCATQRLEFTKEAP